MSVMPMVKSITTTVWSQPAYEAPIINKPGPTDAIVVPSFLTLVVDMIPLVIIQSATQDVNKLQNHMHR